MAKKKIKKKISKKKPNERQALRMVLTGAAALNWKISFNSGGDDEPVTYLILGVESDVDHIAELVEMYG